LNKESVQSFFNSLSEKTILVVGDVMIDAYLWGKVERISPEAPVPIVHIQKKENRLGGAANVALNINSLGAKAIMCSVVGDGSKGDIFRKTAKDLGFSTEGIIDSTERMTTVKTRVISSGHHIVRIDDEITWPLSATDERNLLDCIDQILSKQKVDAIVFEDYDKGVLTEKVIAQVIEKAKSLNIPVSVDPKLKNFKNYIGCSLFKPNFKELKEGMKVEFSADNTTAIEQSLVNLRNELKAEGVIVTRSEHGVTSFDGENFSTHSAHKREIVDVSGAGDTVIAVATLALASNWNLSDIAEIANLAGGLVCEKVGVVPIDKELLKLEAERIAVSV
jgi:rfaE bifunctional protein kinase chain/domain